MGFIFMIIDHIAYFFPIIPYYDIWRSIGRLAFPIFAFFLVEGYYHTSNLKKYKFRLFIASNFMFILNLFFMILRQNKFSILYLFQPNIYFTLLCSLFLIDSIEKLKQRKYIYGLQLLIVILAFSICEYDIYAFSYILIFTLFRNTNIKFLISLIFFGIFCIYKDESIQFWMILSNFLLCFYNGKLGKPFKPKYLFYYLYIIQYIILTSANYLYFYK